MRKLRYFLGGRLFPCALLALLVAAGITALAIWLPRALAPVAVAERLFSLGVALYEVNSSDTAECKLPKLVLIVFLPWTGALLCLIWRRKRLPATETKEAAPFEHGFMQKAAGISKTLCGLDAGYAEEAEYFTVGKEMFERLIPDIAAAKKSVWLEYYIVAHGAFFHAVESLLVQKSAEGLDVRLLYDDFGCSLLLPRNFAKDMQKRGIKTSPTRKIGFPSRALNRRNHRKIAVIDGEIAYTGGLNLADEYIGEKLRFGHWKDTAVRVTGEPAAEFARLFARDAGIENYEPPKPRKGKIPCAVIADGADDTPARAGVSVIESMILSAQSRIWLNTPYLAPDGGITAALKAAAAAGADVRIMIPHIPDKRTAFLISKSYARELIGAGVRIREYTAGFLHAKSAVCDGRYAFVSSYNLDFRSLYLQAECGIILDDEALAAKLEEDFLSAWNTGSAVKKASWAERRLCAVLRLFSPLV